MIRCESRDAHVSRYNHPEFREGFESILPWSDEQFDGMADLSAIHRYVLGIGHTPYNSLTDLLEESAPGAIDDKDILGRTALYFAIIKEDFEAAETLLDFDADPNIWAHDISVISRFLNAFHRLLCFRLNDNPERMAMVARLLNSKADARITAPKSSRNALHIAARMNSDCPEVIEMLLEAGANPNAKDWFQQTPLNILMGSKFEKVECWKSYVRSFKLMVDYGGDLIYVSPCQSPPLLWAVDLCTTNPEYVEILETILEQPDINYLVKNPLEKTILHYAAFKYYPVDLKVMELLTEKCRDWEGLDIYAKDIFGYTAMDLAWGKDGSKYRGDEWDAALERLFQAVDPEYVFQRAITELVRTDVLIGFENDD